MKKSLLLFFLPFISYLAFSQTPFLTLSTNDDPGTYQGSATPIVLTAGNSGGNYRGSIVNESSAGPAVNNSMFVANISRNGANMLHTPSSGTLYVDSSVASSGDGSTWTSAIKELREALAAASQYSGITTINVAKGTYKPTDDLNRDSTFSIYRGGLKIYGGYPSGGGQRDIISNPTILSGDIGAFNDGSDNSYHVIVIAGLTSSADSLVVDGFTISHGNANGQGTFSYGGASTSRQTAGAAYIIRNANSGKLALVNLIFRNNFAITVGGAQVEHSSPFISNCNFSSNNSSSQGGGICITQSSAPLLINCTFAGNRSDGMGGGIYNTFYSAPVITNCIFSSNGGYNGGGIASDYSASLALTNCTISGNSTQKNGNGGGVYMGFGTSAIIRNSLFTGNTGAYGGGIFISSSSAEITNCTISANSSAGWGGIANDNGSVAVSNSIIWGNNGPLTNIYNSPLNITNSILETGYNGTGNVNADPLFVNINVPAGTDGMFGTADDGLSLSCGSPAINKGKNAAIAGTATDIAGSSRIQYSTVDLGAYESPYDTPLSPAVSISASPGSTVCSGTTVSLAAIPVNGGSSPAYQWKKNGANIAGATAATYILNAVNAPDSGEYTVEITSACGLRAISKTTYLTISSVAAPEVTISNNCGSSILSTKATGTLLWNTGAAGPSIIVNTSGTYTVTQTVDGCISRAGEAVAAPKTIPATPVIITDGASTFYTGGSVTLSAPTAASYRWSTGAITQSIKVSSSGSYSVSVTNTVGCESSVSNPVIVTVQAPPSTLSIAYMDGDYKQLTNNIIRPYLQLNNDGTSPVAYKDITIRYWLTVEDFAPMTNLSIDWAQIGANKLKMKYVKLSKPLSGAFGYIEYSFDASAGNLAAKSNSGLVQSGVGKSDWTNFNEGNDYSYSSYNTYTKNSKITAYQNGTLVWGTEPVAVTPVQSLKAYSQDMTYNTSTNSIATYLKLNNEGNTPVSFKDITIRYWFTADGQQALNYNLDYAQMGSNNIKYKFVKSLSFSGVDTYLELSFSAADSLYPISTTGNIQQRINKSDWSMFNQLNDYSYKPGGAMGENIKITVYVNGILVYGLEPSYTNTAYAATAGEMNSIAKETDGKTMTNDVAQKLSVTILNNPIISNDVEYIVRGVEGKQVQVTLLDAQGRVINLQQFRQAGAVERNRLSVKNSAALMLFLRVSTQNDVKTIPVMRTK